MGIPLNVLIVEDSEEDGLLILHELKNGGYDTLYKRVYTLEAMSNALDAQSWDIILSDYQMPNFNGLNALTLVKEKGIDIPFILVSGAISEEMAIEAMKAGAHDFVLKNDLSRLVPAIKRELKEAKIREERRQTIKALKESENLYRTIFENTGTAMVIINEDTRIALSNIEVEKIFGYKKDELEGKKSWTEIVVKEDIDRLMEYHRLRRIKSDLAPRSYETKIIDKHGNIRDVYVNATLIPETKQTLASLIDITERKKMEDELKRRVKELEDFYEMAIGRELRMIELKEEIERLKEELEKYKK
ncbi:MAG: PAS domain S-box protein [Nitrospirae bacterium]|nr:PAS domain S-box protein [Nitrospirota bacterium]